MCESKDGFTQGVCAGAVANFIDAMNDYQSQRSRLHGYPRHMFICWSSPPKTADPETNLAHAMVAIRYLDPQGVAIRFLHRLTTTLKKGGGGDAVQGGRFASACITFASP